MITKEVDSERRLNLPRCLSYDQLSLLAGGDITYTGELDCLQIDNEGKWYGLAEVSKDQEVLHGRGGVVRREKLEWEVKTGRVQIVVDGVIKRDYYEELRAMIMDKGEEVTPEDLGELFGPIEDSLIKIYEQAGIAISKPVDQSN